MSQHRLTTNDNNLFLYGFDAPTGGFFYSVLDENEDEIAGDDGLTLTELSVVFLKYKVRMPMDTLLLDFNNAQEPAEIQIQIARLFGKDIKQMLQRVRKDMEGYIKERMMK
jgi:hypothetical protein